MRKIRVIIAGVGLLNGSVSNASWMDDLIDAIPIPGGGANTQTQPQRQDITQYQQRSTQYQRDTSTRLTDRQSVADAQRMLSRLGYNVGVVDGIYGKKTSHAIKSFQRSRGTSSDGFVTLGLLDELTDATNGVRSSDNVSGSQELANAQKKDKQQATLIGAVGGAIAGTMLADKLGLSKGQGAAAGAAVGGIGGYVVGGMTADNRGKYAEKYDKIDRSINATDKKISALESKISLVDSNVRSREREIIAVQHRAKKGEDVVAQTNILLKSLDSDITQSHKLAKKTRVAIKVVQDDITEVETIIKADPENQGFRLRRDQLVKRRAELIVSLNTINGITPKLEEQQEDLRGLSLG